MKIIMTYLAELVARIPQNHEVRVGLSECIYLDVGDPGEASVGRHVEDQHGLGVGIEIMLLFVSNIINNINNITNCINNIIICK